MFSPGKASNAGGVATSGLEMAQNSQRLHWTREEVDEKLHQIMKKIHENCVHYGRTSEKYIDYVKGAKHCWICEGRRCYARSRSCLRSKNFLGVSLGIIFAI